MSKKIVLILSGGLDSTTLFYKFLTENNKIAALTFNYKQKHKKEIQAAIETVKYAKSIGYNENIVEHKILDISSINEIINNSSLTNDKIDVPEGHYEDTNMIQTIVPNRNMIFLSLAIGYAVNINAGYVSYAAHSGDHSIYPDCRPLFVEKMKQVSMIANYEPVEILTPFLNINKTEILKTGLSLTPPVNYALTWTCYKGLEKACGKCGSCVERLEAFQNLGIKDPLIYFKTN